MRGKWTANDHALYYTAEGLQIIVDLQRSSDDLFHVAWKSNTRDWSEQSFVTYNEAHWSATRMVEAWEGG